MSFFRNELGKLRRQNDWVAWKQLPQQDKALLQMVAIVRVQGVGLYDAEIIRKDVIGMMLEAKARGEDPAQVFGGDVRAFSESVAENAPKRWRYKTLLNILQKIGGNLLWFSVVQLQDSRPVPISPLVFVLWGLWGVIMVWTSLPRFGFGYNRGWKRVWVVVAVVALYQVYNRAFWSAAVMPVLFSVDRFVLLGVCLALFIAARLAWNRYIAGRARENPAVPEPAAGGQSTPPPIQ